MQKVITGLTLCVLYAGAVGAQEPAAAVGVSAPVGVVADPCVQAAGQPAAVDWAQRCHYRDENAALPAATSSRVIFLGDSITEGWKSLAPDFFVNDRLDRGISGQTTEQMLLRLRGDILDLHPAVLHIMAGTNDIAGNIGPTSLAIIQGNIDSMVALARLQGIEVIVASVPPAAAFPWRPQVQPTATIQALNVWLRALSVREHLVYADYTSVLEDGHGGMQAEYSQDGVHPNAAGYAAMKPVAEAAVARALALHHRRMRQHRPRVPAAS